MALNFTALIDKLDEFGYDDDRIVDILTELVPYRPSDDKDLVTKVLCQSDAMPQHVNALVTAALTTKNTHQRR